LERQNNFFFGGFGEGEFLGGVGKAVGVGRDGELFVGEQLLGAESTVVLMIEAGLGLGSFDQNIFALIRDSDGRPDWCDCSCCCAGVLIRNSEPKANMGRLGRFLIPIWA
jgi:hypothetical protein